jgi:hypothetical protein
MQPKLSAVQAVLVWFQGLYFAITGIWPLISMAAFEAVTGSKTDDWLVKTVGALILVAATVLLRAAFMRTAYMDTFIVGAGSAVVLLTVDVVYACKKIVSPIYLGDAVLEVLFICAWVLCARNQRN